MERMPLDNQTLLEDMFIDASDESIDDYAYDDDFDDEEEMDDNEDLDDNEEFEDDEDESNRYSTSSETDLRNVVNFFLQRVHQTDGSLSLLQGSDLFRPVTKERIESIYPTIEKDLRKYFQVKTYWSTQINEELLEAMLQLFAKEQYEIVKKELIAAGCQDHIGSSIWRATCHCPQLYYSTIAQRDAIEWLVNRMEGFRRFFLTAKTLKQINEIQHGDILYTGKLAVDLGYQAKYSFSYGLSFEAKRKIPKVHEINHLQYVIAMTHKFNYLAITDKLVKRLNGNSVEEWFSIVKDIDVAFPSTHMLLPGRHDQTVEGIGETVNKAIGNKYINWLRQNVSAWSKHCRSKERIPQTPLLLSDLSSEFRKKLLDTVKAEIINRKANDYRKPKTIVKWQNGYYEMPNLLGFLGRPVQEYILTADDYYWLDWGLKCYDHEYAVRNDLQVIILEPEVRTEFDVNDKVVFEQPSLF